MKKVLSTLIFICLAIGAFSQAPVTNFTVKGLVVDSVTSKPLSYVTVALQDAKSHQAVKSTLTKDNGSFELKGSATQSYELVLAFVGYKNKIVPLKSVDNNLGKLVLLPSTNQLKEVSISAVKPVMKQEVDRLSYDVTADPESKALSALDMMRKVPLLSVDGEDNIKLKGSGNYKILINGKESALMAKSPSDVLKSMPATNIEKIEVITTPPAKYDAEGLAGIINIITKKNADQGYNGSINTRYNSVFGPGLNLNGTVKQGKFGVSGYFGFGNNNKTTFPFGNSETQFASQSVISQTGNNTNTGHYKYGNAELSYEIDTLNLLTGSFEIFDGHWNQAGDQISTQFNAANQISQAYHLINTNNNHNQGMDLALNYQLGFKKSKEELLTTSYKYSYSPNTQSGYNNFDNRTNYDPALFPDYNQYNNAGAKEHTFQVDYVYPTKKINLETGAKAIFRNNFSDYTRQDLDPATNEYVTNASQSNVFNYQQNVYSIYNSYQLKFTKWTIKGGLRLEHTQVSAVFTGVPLNEGYNNLIPSVSIQKNLKGSSLNFGFTQRIQRPGIYQLNPFVDRSNPLFINTGNPNLRPELDNTFELNFSKFGQSSINIGVSYAFSNNAIQNVSNLQVNNLPNNKIDTVTFTTYQNLGSNKNLGLNINTNLNITKKLSFSLNTRLGHIWLRGTYNGKFYTNDGYTGSVFSNAGYKFDNGFRLGVNAGFFAGDINLQGKNGNGVFSQYVASKEMFNKKFSISFVANNPYAKYRAFTSYTRTPDYYQSSYNDYPYRSFALRLNYKFGKLNSDIKKNQRGINNDDTKGGGKSNSGNQ